MRKSKKEVKHFFVCFRLLLVSAFCQALTSSNHKFSLSLSIGQDNFNFCNKDLVKIPVFKKKKKSPSQMRREAKRKLEREQKNQSEDTESD